MSSLAARLGLAPVLGPRVDGSVIVETVVVEGPGMNITANLRFSDQFSAEIDDVLRRLAVARRRQRLTATFLLVAAFLAPVILAVGLWLL